MLFDPKRSSKDASGTYFHDITVKATPKQMAAIFGDSDGPGDKTNHEWTCELFNGSVFTIYDWKEPYPDENEVIVWHIGAREYSVAVEAAARIEMLVKRLSKH